jgi:hypothetical protein
MTTGRNRIYLLVAFILWITAYGSSFAIKGGTPLGPLLYIIGSVFFLLTQRPLESPVNQAHVQVDEEDETPLDDEDSHA